MTTRVFACALVLPLVLFTRQPEASLQVPTPSPAPIGIFVEPGFPSPEVAPPDIPALRAALAGDEVTTIDAAGLSAWLDAAPSSAVLVMPYGSAFPREAWPAIERFLERGGNWVNVGGVPFGTPVTHGQKGWEAGPRTSAFYKALGFTHPFEVSTGPIASWQAADPAAGTSPLLDRFRAAMVFALDVRLSNTRDFADEDGTTGQRDARLTPLVVGVDAAGTRLAAPFLRLDRLSGPFAGGAWLLAPLAGTVDAAGVAALVRQAGGGALDLVARPSMAGFQPGEPASIELQVRRPRRRVESLAGTDECLVEVLEASGRPVASGRARLAGEGEWRSGTFRLPSAPPLPRGLYKVRATMEVAAGAGAPRHVRSTTGFWVYDAAMLEGGKPITVRGAGFERDGRPFPIVGTTYMASDVHRKFLLEPNPYFWDRDFAAMRASGVNLVRTGLWTGWKIYMPEVGSLNETFLRSLDVFLLTARKHDIPVVFTFFAFLPETWGGRNPFLDPRAVSAQAAFLSAVARRYARVEDVGWDLINEPSFSSAAQLWKTRPNYDTFEAQAWQEWLVHRHGGNPASATDATLRAWDATPGEDLSLPPLDAFTDRTLFGSTRPRAILDYRLFAQDSFASWARTMRQVLKANGNARQLVTVGQDEGGLVDRPGPLFFGREMDYTCMHTWWNNDALAWDSVVSRLPDRPLLVEETGLMRYERVEGTPWRTEVDNARLLERKLAIALGTGSAGAVQWIWNTNPYMASDNEAGIGFFRADLTARPELKPFAAIAHFLEAHAARLASRQAEDVVLLVPQSHVLSVRDYGTEATRRAVRALYYHLHVPVRAVGEYQAEDALGTPKAIIAPSPVVIGDRAWTALLAAVERGATLVLTGPLERDEYWRPAARLARLGLESTIAPVASSEPIDIGGQVFNAGFRGDKLEKVEKAVATGAATTQAASIVTVRHGKGTVIWSPLPLELAESVEPTAAFYRAGLAQARVSAPISISPADPGMFAGTSRFADTLLVALASESSRDRTVEIRVAGSAEPARASVPAGRALLLLFDARTGQELARTTPPGL